MPDERRLFWGDLHSHCAISYGYGSLERAFALARQHLDFCSVTGHATWHDMPTDRERYGRIIDFHREGFERLKRNWKAFAETTRRHDRPGAFVTLPSYEWHSRRYGDHNVYFLEDDAEIVERPSLAELEAALAGSETMIVPHHLGYGPGFRGIDWQEFDARRSPVVEVFSGHGSSERDGGPYPMYHTMGPRSHRGTVAHGLALGKRFGFVAGTDHHGGYPGHYGEGRTAVYAAELTRPAIWEALGARRCYAVTGDRIAVDVRVNDGVMGEEITAEARELRVRVRGADALDRVEVVKNGRPLKRVFGRPPPDELPDPIHAKLRIEWGWGDQHEAVRWDGELRLSEGSLLSVEPCFSGEPLLAPSDAVELESDETPIHGLVHQEHQELAWYSHTRGNPHPLLRGTSALVLELRAPRAAELHLRVNGSSFSHRLAELLEGSRSHFVRGWRSEALLLHRAVPERCLTQELDFSDHPEAETDWYYVRVAQENGQWAWTSPIWATR